MADSQEEKESLSCKKGRAAEEGGILLCRAGKKVGPTGGGRRGEFPSLAVRTGKGTAKKKVDGMKWRNRDEKAERVVLERGGGEEYLG